ncbi:MAG: polyphosphate polymerase domain-containing protein [Bacteroidales bacterium]|nr:polyphosphate polymerase domain-containing protein [Bacteroidales bacterium]MCD8395451.1 polyphosphate polymerase domain-containing protein [Bacteroidales bacterium]
MNDIASILQAFQPISLSEMSGIKLMNRTDTKFITTLPMLQRLLEMASSAYFAQEIDGQRIAHYFTSYFDTRDCEMYTMHQNGRLNRQKLRIRSYVDSQMSFLEVKTKNNHGRTKKRRIAIDNFDPLKPARDITFDTPEQRPWCDFLGQHLRFPASDLSQRLENRFSRITLVNRNRTERLTIDFDLRFHNLATGNDMDMGSLVIIELKRDGLTPSPILEILRELRIHPHGFSKYCMGAALTDQSLKRNCIKTKIQDVKKLINAI